MTSTDTATAKTSSPARQRRGAESTISKAAPTTISETATDKTPAEKPTLADVAWNQFITAIKQSQEMALAMTSTWVEGMSRMLPRTPRAVQRFLGGVAERTEPLASRLTKSTNAGCDQAAEFLAAQRDYATGMLELLASRFPLSRC